MFNRSTKSHEAECFERIHALDKSRDCWIKRVVLTIDFSEGLDTFCERASFDLDTDYLIRKTFDKYYYIPVGWRERAPFLELDCKTQSGNSLQLLPLSFREKYVEWAFWELCNAHGYINSQQGIPICLRNRIMKQIQGKDLEQPDHRCCNGHTCDHEEIWNKIMKDSEVVAFYEKMQIEQPLILRVNIDDNDTLSMIKIMERKPLRRPDITRANRRAGHINGIVEARNATSIKFVAPPDTRIKKVRGSVIQDSSHSGENAIPILQAKVFGDGSWAHLNQRTEASRFLWTLTFTPRRSYLFTPAIRIAALGLIACIYWMISAFGVTDISGIRNSYSMVVVTSFYLYHIRLLYKNYSHSFLYNWITSRYRHLLTWTMILVLTFPFTSYIIGRIKGATPILKASSQTRTLGNVDAYVKWGIIIFILVSIKKFIHVYTMTKPSLALDGK